MNNSKLKDFYEQVNFLSEKLMFTSDPLPLPFDRKGNGLLLILVLISSNWFFISSGFGAVRNAKITG